jgi:hypothetical protein
VKRKINTQTIFENTAATKQDKKQAKTLVGVAARKKGKESEEYVQQNKVHQNMEGVEVRCGRQHRFERAVFGSTSLREMARRGEERREGEWSSKKRRR